MAAQLKYLSDKALAELRGGIDANHLRYRGEGFADLAQSPAWDIGLGIEYDDALLATLDKSRPQVIAGIDLENSKIVGQALSRLTPTLANEERIWARLAHVDAFDYSKARWLDSEGDEKLSASVEKHMFASTQTGIRDDHSLSRLWWNYHIAKTCQPNDIEGALALILKTTDIRLNFVERIWMTSRRAIASAALKAMAEDAWVTATASNFRDFMKALNRFGGGIVFEALDAAETEAFVARCLAEVKKKFAA